MSKPTDPEEVPVLGRWSRWYWLLMLALVAQLLFFVWLTEHFK